MKMKKTIHMQIAACLLFLLAAGAAGLSAGSPGKSGEEGYSVRESPTVQVLDRKGDRGGAKAEFKCRAVRYGDGYMLLASVLRNDSAVHVVSPGVEFLLAGGGSVVLEAQRPQACCSGWADGRWYNAAFVMSGPDVVRLRDAEVEALRIHSDKGEILRQTAPGRRDALAKMIRSVEGE